MERPFRKRLAPAERPGRHRPTELERWRRVRHHCSKYFLNVTDYRPVCGIAGFYGDFDRDLLDQMSGAIAHRGPDGEGTIIIPESGLGLAHRRLSIIDLSERGRQPMWDASETVVIVYNGELYNFRELRETLIGKGYTFRSQTDTEVLLNLYREYGEDMLGRLNGMFAFAIWDAGTKSLFLARDGMGVKPLYYAETPAGFLFASELKSLLASPDVDRTVNPAAIRNHLRYLWCPAPETMLQSVRKLEPGCALVVRHGKVARRWTFYDLPYDQPIAALSDEEAAEELQVRLQEAVRRQMVADVEVGAFLSGGLDSSSLVAMARDAEPGRRLQCFTIGFRDERQVAEEGFPVDLPYAERVAQHLDVDLHTVWVGSEMIDEIETMLYHLDEPQADPAPLNAYFICRLAREQGIKVLLSGAGGDDILGGYRRHYALQLERYWSWLPRSGRRILRQVAERIPTSNAWGRRFARAFGHADWSPQQRIEGYFRWIGPTLEAELAGPLLKASPEPESPLRASLRRLPAGVPPLNQMLYLDAKHFLIDHNLNYTDRMSMATGVETRVPLLDPDFVAFAARLPVHMKQRGPVGKWIFKKAMEPYLPHDVIYRPKGGFGAPIRGWLGGPLRPLVDDVLSETSLSRRGLFDPQAVRRLIALDRAGRVDVAYPLFALVCIELWCRLFLDASRAAIIERSTRCAA